MEGPTRREETRSIDDFGNATITGEVTEYASLHHVTLTQDAKKVWRVSEVKLYGQDPMAIATEIANVAVRANDSLKATGLPTE